MGILAWIVLGVVAGFIASLIMNKSGEGLVGDLILGVVGAVVGGWIASALGNYGVTGFNLHSIAVAVVGAVVVLGIYHAVKGRRAV